MITITRQMYIGALLLLVLVVGLAMPAQIAHAADLCVDLDGVTCPYSTIEAAVTAASAGDTINVHDGTYVLSSMLTLDKMDLTLHGVDNPLIQVSGTGERFYITAPGVTIDGFTIEKTDKVGVQNIIYVGAPRTSITSNEIFGHYVIGENDVSRAIVVAAGSFYSLNISGNTIHDLRQPAYISGVHTGTISNNYVYLTKGWVVEGGNLTFTNNTWGTGANANVFDIAILSLVGPSYYTNIPAVSAANNGAFIEDQRTSPFTLSIVYVDASVGASGTGTATSPVKTIAEGITRVVTGGMIHVVAGTYVENITITKSLTLEGSGAANTSLLPAVSNPNCGGSGGGSLCAGASNVILVQANNVVIHDLTVDGDNPALVGGFDVGGANVDARNGIITNHNAGNFTGLEVYNTTIRNIFLRGLYASTNGTFNFHHNTVTNVRADSASIGIFAWYGPGIIANNTVSYANDAISANHSKGIQFLNNTVTHSASGVHTDNSGDSGGVADLIQGNTVSDCSADGYGIWTFVNYLPVAVENNTITNCTIGLSAWGTAPSIITPVTFTGNVVTGPNKAVGSVGAYITTSGAGWGYYDLYANFTNNTFTNFEIGVQLSSEETTWDPAPFVQKSIHSALYHNKIYGNTDGADKGASLNVDADLTQQWWGAVNGPSGAGTGSGDSVGAGLPYIPWCGDAACSFLVQPPGSFAKTSPENGTTNLSSTLTLYWSASSGATGYEYCISMSSTSCSTWVSRGTQRNVTLTGLNAGTTYYWHVRAINVGGTTYSDGSDTALWSFTTATPTFQDVPLDYWSWNYIERLYAAGVTGGCGTNPLVYCPTAAVTRDQMAVFLLKGEHGSSYVPPAVGASTGFSDVPTTYWAAAWIKQLAAEGITAGCGGGKFCPGTAVTRDQMAVFLLKAKHGTSYVPPVSTGVFTDVPTNYWAAAWIEQLAAEGITAGCGGGNFCPNTPVTRDQMAVFLVKTFNLP